MPINFQHINTGMDAFLKQLQIGEGNRRAQQKMQQEQQANEQLNQYRQGELGIQGRNADLRGKEFGLKDEQFDLNKQKLPLLQEYIKAQTANQKSLVENRKNKGNILNGLTQANITKNQSIMQNVDNVTPLINELMAFDVPGQLTGKYIHPNDEKAYEAKTAAITDSLVSAMNLPKTNESLELAKTMVRQGKFETQSAYRKRLGELIKDLSARKGRAQKAIKTGLFSDDTENNNPSDESSGSNNDPLGLGL